MSDFRIQTCVLGMVSTNTYIIYRKGGREAVLVDPADNAPYLLNKCRELGVEPSAVVLTHGHFDHIMAVEDICRSFPCRVYASADEAALLEDPDQNLSVPMGMERTAVEADELVRDGQVLNLLGLEWKVIATPGHTAGSVCYYIPEESVLISGDTLFAESLGRTDLPTGSAQQIIRSITEKLFMLPDDTMVYPGHGDPTTIGHEKQYNPAAPYWRRQK
ncbi:MAG: MBL fold metallo-hydrolase [Eubacteriales bacterium]|nr:MBL fold metallo-hydrolase [Eubacteriales bacterium]